MLYRISVYGRLEDSEGWASVFSRHPATIGRLLLLTAQSEVSPMTAKPREILSKIATLFLERNPYPNVFPCGAVTFTHHLVLFFCYGNRLPLDFRLSSRLESFRRYVLKRMVSFICITEHLHEISCICKQWRLYCIYDKKAVYEMRKTTFKFNVSSFEI